MGYSVAIVSHAFLPVMPVSPCLPWGRLLSNSIAPSRPLAKLFTALFIWLPSSWASVLVLGLGVAISMVAGDLDAERQASEERAACSTNWRWRAR